MKTLARSLLQVFMPSWDSRLFISSDWFGRSWLPLMSPIMTFLMALLSNCMSIILSFRDSFSWRRSCSWSCYFFSLGPNSDSFSFCSSIMLFNLTFSFVTFSKSNYIFKCCASCSCWLSVVSASCWMIYFCPSLSACNRSFCSSCSCTVPFSSFIWFSCLVNIRQTLSSEAWKFWNSSLHSEEGSVDVWNSYQRLCSTKSLIRAERVSYGFGSSVWMLESWSLINFFEVLITLS